MAANKIKDENGVVRYRVASSPQRTKTGDDGVTRYLVSNRKDDKKTSTWLQDSNALLNAASEDQQSRRNRYNDPEEYNEYRRAMASRINRYLNDYSSVSATASDEHQKALEQTREALLAMQNSLGQERVLYNSDDYFKNQEEFDEHKAYTDALKYDIAAAEAERDRLIAEDKEYANTQYQGVSDMGFVPTYKNKDRIAQLNSEISNAQKVQDDARRQTELASMNLDELQAEIDSLSEAQEAAREDYRLWQLETNSIDVARERNMEEADQHLADLRRDYREASKIQDDIYYTSLPEAEDFDELSQEDDRNPLAYRDRLKKNAVSEVDTTEAESALTENERAQLEYMRQYAELAGVDHITEDERKVFNYLYNTKGLGEAIKYLDYLDATVQQRRGQALADTVAKNGDVGMYAMMPVVAGADNLGRSTQQIAELMGGDTSGVDVSVYAYANEAMKENASPIYALYSDVVSNLVSNSPAYVMGGYGQIFSKLAGISGWLSSGILGTSAAGGGIADALNNGYTIDEAITYGLITGISETLMEKALGSLGGGKLPDMMENGIRNVGAYFAKGATGKTASKVVNAFTWLGRTASAGAGEFVEEYLQEVLNPVFRNATLGENNDVNLFSEEALYSGLVGAISGGMMSIAGTGADDAAGRRYVTELQNIAAKDNIDISTNGVARFVADAAIKTGNDTLVEMGEKVIAQIDKGTPVSYMDIGALERLVPNLYLTGSLEGYAISKKDAEKAVAAAEQTHEDYLDGKEVEGGVDATIDAVNAEMNGTERIVPSRISATDEELGLTEETSEVDKSLVTGRNNATLHTGDGSTQVEVVGIGETAGGEFSVRLSDGRVVDASRITMNDSTLHDVIQTAGRSTSKESSEFKFKGMKAQIALYGAIGRGDSVYDSAVRFGRKADFAADASDAEVEAYAREQASVFLQATGTEGIAKDLVYYGILDGAMQKVADLNENHTDLSKIARDATTKKGIETYEKASKDRKINNNRSMFGYNVGDDVDAGVVFEGTANTRRISRKDKAIIEVINEQAIELGKKVIIHDVIISNGKEVEGVWKMDDGIHISLSNMGGAIKELEDFHAFVGLSIFDHEAFHEIKAKAPDIAKAAIEFTREQYSEEEWNKLVEEKTALYRAYGQRLSREGIEEEITADHFTYFMMQRTNLQAIAEKYFTQAELAVGEFDRLMAITLGVWDNQKNISPEFLSDKETLQKASEIANRAIEAVKGNKKTASEEKAEKNSLPANVINTTYIDDNPATHTIEQMKIINEYKNAIDGNLLEKLNQYEMSGVFGSYEIAKKVPKGVADAVSYFFGEDVSKSKIILDTDQVEHIIYRHGKNGKANQSMQHMEDLSRVRYILENYDEAYEYGERSKHYFDSKGKTARTVAFGKKLNGTYYACVTGVQTKKEKIFIVTCFIDKAEEFLKKVSQNKKTRTYRKQPNTAKQPSTNAQDGTSTNVLVSNYSMQETDENVNEKLSVPDGSTSLGNNQIAVADDIAYDDDVESAARFSAPSWQETDYVTNREETIQVLADRTGQDVETVEKWMQDIDSVAAIIFGDYARYGYESNPLFSPLKTNSEYKYTIDFSTLCKKRKVFNATYDAIQQYFRNTVLTAEDFVRIREMLKERGHEVACGICYVESTRKDISRITQQFIEAYREAYDGQGYLKFRGKKRYFVEEGYVPELADLNTVDGIGDIQTNHPLVWDAYLAFMNARGMQKPKLLETVSEYTDQILAKYTWRGSTSKTQAKVKTRAVDAMNRRGGLRLQSYSDFEVAQLIDMMQVVLDMATVGLKSQAYTKVPEFAALMGMTGVKINLSLIAKGDGIDENGNLIFDGVEGMDFDTAMKLRDAYSKNVGTILVGKNDAHIRAAMADPRIDFIIPYHRSSWSEALYEKLGLEGYEDYTKTQNERWEDPSAHKKKLKNLDPMAYWDFSKSGDENAQIYLDLCKKEGRVPKFPQFAGEPGYWKLLIDFKMYDNNGVGSPQEVVRPDFNMDTVREIMDAYEGTSMFEAAHDVVQDFIAEKLNDMNKSFTLNVGGSDAIYERLSLPSNGTPTMKDLIRENETQAKMIANLKQQFKLTDGKVIKPADARKIAKSLIKEYGINDVAVDEYADKISTIFTAMRREGVISEDIIDEFGYAYDLARSFATELVENATEIDTTMRDENYEILNHLRTVGILLTDDTREALRDKFGSVRAGMNQYWGRVKFANRHASPPDTLISELNGLRRHRFDVETSAQDAVEQILDFVEACTPTVKNPLTDFFTHQSDAIDAVTISVMEKIAGAGELVTRADRTKAAHDKKVAKLKNEMSTLKKQYREEIRAAEDRAKTLGSRVSNLERWNESRKKTEVRHNIQTMWKKLATWAAKPKNRQYIPEGLFNACVKLLDTVEVTKSDFSKTAMALNELRRQYQAIESSADFSIRNVYDREVADMIYANIELIEHSKIYNNELSLDHLKAIERVFAVVIKAVQHGRSFREIEKGGEIAAGAEEIIATQKRIRDKKASDGKFAKFIKKKANEYLLWTESPERVFHLLDGYDPDGPFTRIFADMMHAYDYKAQIELKARDLFGNLLDGDNEGFNQFFGDKAETVKLRGYDFTFEEEHEIEVTKGMMLSLWFHLQNEQNVKHLAGGVFVPDVKQWKNGNLSGAIESREGYRFNIAELREQVYDFIYDSEYAMDFIDAAKNWFWKMSGEVINKTSLKVDGFRRAEVNNYYPIATESAFNKKDIEEVLTADIIAGNKNFLIDRVKNAGNPILLTDILSVLDKQITQVSNYAAFDAIRKDMSALMNYFRKGYDESLKNSLRKAFGTDKVEKYINELVSDLTGAKQKTDWSKTLNKFQANFARSALSMNPTTPLKQIAAYPQAAYILGWEPMLKATVQSGDVEEINKWTNLYRVREAGGLNNIMGYELPSGDRLGRFMDRHPAWFGWIEKMDLFVVRKIWAAAKEWTRINTDLDEASDEFFQRTAVMFEKAVYQTQDQHMALMSPNIQRHGNTWTRLMFPFITQPLQQAGIVYDAIGDYLANHKNAAERARAEKKLASAVSSTLASYAALSAVTMVGQILMGRASDYEDEEGNLMDFWNWLEQFGYDMIGNMSGMLLGGQDIYELVMHWLTGNRYYGMEIGSIQQVFDAYDGLVYLGDAIKTGDWQKIGDRLLKTGIDVAKAFGIPAGNIQRIAKAFTEHIDTWFLGGSYSSDRTAGQISAMIDNAVKSGDAGYMSQQRTKAADATRELLETKVQGYLNQGYTQAEARSKAGSAVKSALTSYFKPLYLEYRASGDTVSANRIQVMLTSLPLPNKYTSETFQDWWKNRDK